LSDSCGVRGVFVGCCFYRACDCCAPPRLAARSTRPTWLKTRLRCGSSLSSWLVTHIIPPHRRTCFVPPHRRACFVPPRERTYFIPPHERTCFIPPHTRTCLVPPHRRTHTFDRSLSERNNFKCLALSDDGPRVQGHSFSLFAGKHAFFFFDGFFVAALHEFWWICT
jgi:hypothetical protein